MSAGTEKPVSIVLTTLNAAPFLRPAIDSCLGQTYANLELIAVDGGSTDGTIEIIQSYVDARVRLIHQPDNSGKLPGAINLGLESARGDYLTWMQGDSLYDSRAIEIMVRELEAHPDVGQVYADYNEIGPQGEIRRVIHTREPGEFLSTIGDPAGVCFLIRREVREAVGPHDIDTFPSQDYDYRMRIALQFQSRRIPQPLYSWRVHDDSLTGRFGWANLGRRDVQTRIKLGLDTPRQARRRLAEIDMAEAFECYQNGRHQSVPRLVLSGLRGKPAFMTNRGVWSILVRSLAR